MHESESGDETLPRWVTDTLQRPVAASTAARSAIMHRVRHEVAPRAFALPPRASRWRRRGLLTPVGGVSMLMMLCAALWVRAMDTRILSMSIDASAQVLGDSVVPVSEGPAGFRSVTKTRVGAEQSSAMGSASALQVASPFASASESAVVSDGPTVRSAPSSRGQLAARLLDTLRVVEFVVRGRDVRSADVIGDFNAWHRGSTTLMADGSGSWRVRALVPRDALRFAYVVNGASVVSAPPLPTRRATPSLHDSI